MGQSIPAVSRGSKLPPVPGFLSAGVSVGLKGNGMDVGLLYSQAPAAAAGVFTTNRTQAAPVVLSKRQLAASPVHRAVVVNSGCANACTGKEGWKNANEMARSTAKALGIDRREVLVASTGVIGRQLKMPNLLRGIEDLGTLLSRGRSNPHFARAIMTTDTREKVAYAIVRIASAKVTVAGAAKGSGMIHPNMATMLGFIATDGRIARGALQTALRRVTQTTFNMISVDGDTSTNDCVLALASGLAANPEVRSAQGSHFAAFYAALEAVCRDLAIQIVRDGEGATKVFAVRVTGARSTNDARAIAKAVARSNLVKCAVHGADPNWGRIVCAAGYAEAAFNPERARITVSNGGSGPEVALFERGEPAQYDERAAHDLLSNEWITLSIDVGRGPGQAQAWGCDLSHQYVTINAHYRT